jgi:hypothetical protein
MPIDQLASVLESYDEKDFTPEAQKVIKEVIDAREKELEAYRKKKIDYENNPIEGIRLQKSKLFGIIFLIPLIAFCIAEGTQIYFNSELRSAIRKDFPDADLDYRANA